MNTKICTDVNQSKKLIELGIPKNTADMHYSTWTIVSEDGEFIVSVSQQGETIEELQKEYGNQIIPAWSLDALLNIINTNYYTTLYHDGIAWNIDIIHHDNVKEKHSVYANTPVDACYEMILKLKNLSLL